MTPTLGPAPLASPALGVTRQPVRVRPLWVLPPRSAQRLHTCPPAGSGHLTAPAAVATVTARPFLLQRWPPSPRGPSSCSGGHCHREALPPAGLPPPACHARSGPEAHSHLTLRSELGTQENRTRTTTPGLRPIRELSPEPEQRRGRHCCLQLSRCRNRNRSEPRAYPAAGEPLGLDPTGPLPPEHIPEGTERQDRCLHSTLQRRGQPAGARWGRGGAWHSGGDTWARCGGGV